MIIKKGTRLIVLDRRKGQYVAEALRDFDTEKDEFYPVTPLKTVVGMVNTWDHGDEIPCRKGIATIKVKEGEK